MKISLFLEMRFTDWVNYVMFFVDMFTELELVRFLQILVGLDQAISN